MMNFALLHRQDGPLLIANVWDVSSARAAQAAGYQAIGTPVPPLPRCMAMTMATASPLQYSTT